MVELAIDTEQTIHNTGSHNDTRNFTVCISGYDGKHSWCIFDVQEKENKEFVQQQINKADTLVFHNAKYDLHWLDKNGLDYTNKKIRDTMVVEFRLNKQQTPFPSLDNIAEKYLGEKKLDIIKLEFWDKGIQTDQIPRLLLEKYAINDVVLTWKCYQKQKELIKPYQQTIINLACQDTVVLKKAESYGARYDRNNSLNLAEKLKQEIVQIQDKQYLRHSVPAFNWNSTTHVSALLFGGTISILEREPVGYWKTGKKQGTLKYKRVIKEYHLPRQYTPLKGTKLVSKRKEDKDTKAIYSIEEDHLRKIDDGSDLISNILRIKKLQKDISTYLDGLPLKQIEMHQESLDYLYTNFNQVRAITTRLSSSNPNFQNLSDNALRFFISRYD